MNTGAEAVETAIKAARRWGYRVKGVPRDRAEIIVADGNFHGRTTTIISFSSEPDYRDGFGPFTPGFRSVPFGDLAALERAITPHTVAVLVEPIQGEAGIIVPPAGWLAGVRRLCDAHDVLLILDEVQSGLGRTGAWFAFEHEGVRPDGLVLGKALGGGVLPVSAFVGTARGHGRVHARDRTARPSAAIRSPPRSASKRCASSPMRGWWSGAACSAPTCSTGCARSRARSLKEVRGRGLWAGAEIDPRFATARAGLRAPARRKACCRRRPIAPSCAWRRRS